MIQQQKQETKLTQEHNGSPIGERVIGALFFLLGGTVLWLATLLRGQELQMGIAAAVGALLLATATSLFARARTLACWLLLLMALPLLIGGAFFLLAAFSAGVIDKTSLWLSSALVLSFAGFLVGVALWVRRMDA